MKRTLSILGSLAVGFSVGFMWPSIIRERSQEVLRKQEMRAHAGSPDESIVAYTELMNGGPDGLTVILNTFVDKRSGPPISPEAKVRGIEILQNSGYFTDIIPSLALAASRDVDPQVRSAAAKALLKFKNDSWAIALDLISNSQETNLDVAELKNQILHATAN